MRATIVILIIFVCSFANAKQPANCNTLFTLFITTNEYETIKLDPKPVSRLEWRGWGYITTHILKFPIPISLPNGSVANAVKLEPFYPGEVHKAQFGFIDSSDFYPFDYWTTWDYTRTQNGVIRVGDFTINLFERKMYDASGVLIESEDTDTFVQGFRKLPNSSQSMTFGNTN